MPAVVERFAAQDRGRSDAARRRRRGLRVSCDVACAAEVAVAKVDTVVLGLS